MLTAVAKETEFELWGFVFVMLAAVMSGFRWTMTQILLQVLTEYILVSITSAVTVTIAGIVKEAVTILVAVFYFHDPFTWLKGVGLIIIMVGVSLFNLYKYQKLQKGELGDENIARSSATKTPARYVILEDLDDQDDGP
ncbi:nucleotide/sugar transporter family protein [Actinidia rufa]|uniref:Nucleotide/sugar transporter family protein n=1 Tax=Actinidia rufa TaxID=165716 RepID=A0A7J0DYK7_9ERIC|nr:nucleotide/sugar transporter family protein [Actinidia rufa]